jgi:drug/metabolite transporter (DMT)-like permease
VVISAFVSVAALPVIWFMADTSLIPDDWHHIGVFALVGFLHTALIWFYLTALNEEDTTTIVVFYSILPILGLVTSNFFLDESFSTLQLGAMVIIIIGILLVTIEKGPLNEYRFKFKAAFLMFLASLCWALGDVAFKFVAIEENIWRSLFWEHVILFIVGSLFFFGSRKIRSEIHGVLRSNTTKIIGINLTSEMLYIFANIVSAFPLIMVQIAAVHLVQAFQPIWVFLIGLLLWKAGATRERYTKGQMIQKGLATIIAVCGMYLLAISTSA